MAGGAEKPVEKREEIASPAHAPQAGLLSPSRFASRAGESLDDLSAFFQTALGELRNPHPLEVGSTCANIVAAAQRSRAPSLLGQFLRRPLACQ